MNEVRLRGVLAGVEVTRAINGVLGDFCYQLIRNFVHNLISERAESSLRILEFLIISWKPCNK